MTLMLSVSSKPRLSYRVSERRLRFKLFLQFLSLIIAINSTVAQPLEGQGHCPEGFRVLHDKVNEVDTCQLIHNEPHSDDGFKCPQGYKFQLAGSGASRVRCKRMLKFGPAKCPATDGGVSYLVAKNRDRCLLKDKSEVDPVCAEGSLWVDDEGEHDGCRKLEIIPPTVPATAQFE